MRISSSASFLILFFALSLLPDIAQAKFDDMARYAFVSSKERSSIVVVDLHERNRAGEIFLAIPPESVVASESLKALFVAHTEQKRLTLVDLMSEEMEQVDYPLEIHPDVLMVSPIGETVAVWDRDLKKLEIHAVKRKKILVAYTDVDTQTGFTFNPDGSTIYWVNGDTGTLNSADLWSNRKWLTLAGDETNLSAMSRSIDGRLGFVSDQSQGGVHVVDLQGFRLIRTTNTGAQPLRPQGTSDGQFMLIPHKESGFLAVVSAATGEHVYTQAALANAVSVNPGWVDTMAAVVSDKGEVVFVRILDGKTLSEFSIPGKPVAAVVTSDSKTLAVSVPDRGVIEFFDMRERSRLSALGGLPGDAGALVLAVSNNLCH